MGILRRPLKENFKYSTPVDRSYIRKLARKCVTQRRSHIMSSMTEGGDKPTGLDIEVW